LSTSALGSVRVNLTVGSVQRAGRSESRLGRLRDRPYGMNKHRTDDKKHADVSDQANEKKNCTWRKEWLAAVFNAVRCVSRGEYRLVLLQCSSCMEPLLPCRLHTCLRCVKKGLERTHGCSLSFEVRPVVNIEFDELIKSLR
jgi:hypothetical protein